MFREVDAMHKHQSDLDGIFELSYMVDAKLVSSYFHVAMPIATSAQLMPDQLPSIKLLGPSMEIFYANLGKIVRGEWWMFDTPLKSTRRIHQNRHAGVLHAVPTPYARHYVLCCGTPDRRAYYAFCQWRDEHNLYVPKLAIIWNQRHATKGERLFRHFLLDGFQEKQQS
jgi:hypothetical protein